MLAFNREKSDFAYVLSDKVCEVGFPYCLPDRVNLLCIPVLLQTEVLQKYFEGNRMSYICTFKNSPMLL
jgi:hypothetical protein